MMMIIIIIIIVVLFDVYVLMCVASISDVIVCMVLLFILFVFWLCLEVFGVDQKNCFGKVPNYL